MGSDVFSLFLVWLLSKCRSGPGGGYAPALPGGEPGWPGSPISYPPTPTPVSTAPAWPAAATETGLPPFPGSSWEFDEPPPPEVKTRAGQLVSSLWATGTGSFRIERTGGRPIAYQAQVVASGRKGVVAYRIKGQRPSASAATAARPQARPVQPRAAAPRPAAPRPAPRPAPAAPRPSAASPASSSPPRPAAAAAAPAPAVQVVPSQLNLPTLKQGWGMKPAPPHKDVVLLQQRLGITADGRFGPGTDAAVRTFQRRNGMVVDGIVGQKTWAALFAVRA